MKRLNSFLLLLPLTLFNINARTINGQVFSAVDSLEVPGATCKLFYSGEGVGATQTDSSGLFKLGSEINGPLSVVISMVGYEPSEILVEPGKEDVDLGAVYLEENNLLSEVTVTAQGLVESKGRSILYPSKADVKASSTALSLFQKLPLPGLEANLINRSISVDGGTPFILINGVPSSPEDLYALQPKDIERLEYSRFTPARYADKSKTGFINVILKKRTDGGQVYMWGRSAVSTAFVDATVRGSYHQGPSQFTLSYNPSWRNYQKVYDNVRESFVGDDFRVDLETQDRNPFNYFTNNLSAKYDFTPSSKTLFSATFRAYQVDRRTRLIGETVDLELGKYSVNNSTKDNSFNPSLDLFLRQEFNSNNQMEIEVVGTLASNDYLTKKGYFFENANDELFIVDANSNRRSLISEVTYIHDFSSNVNFSAGYQNTVSYNKNKYKTTDYEPILKENNNYVYARVGATVGKFYLMASSGAKLFWTENDDLKRNFIRNISMGQVSWSISQKWNLAAGFSYIPSIPTLSQLTDYPQQTTPYLIANGNPELKVSEAFLYQLMPSFIYKKLNVSLLMNYQTINNPVVSDVIYMGDGMFLSQSVNARRLWNADGNLNIRMSDISGFGFNVSIGLKHTESTIDNWSHHLTALKGSCSLWWNKGPYTISYWRKLPGKYLYGTYVGKDENGDALSFEYTPNKHWTVGATWMYMFDRKGTRYPSWNYSKVNPSTQYRHISNNANMVCLTLSYSADFGSNFRTGKRQLNNSDNGSSLLKY